MDNIRVIMFSEKRNVFCDYAELLLKSYFNNKDILSIRSNVGDRFGEELHWYRLDYMISFLSPWIIPPSILHCVQKASANFHPGSPDYPGLGCYHFALYDDSKKYGVTVHHMEENVNAGNMIMTSDFDISPFETVETLKLKSMSHLLCCFEKILSYMSASSVNVDSRMRGKW